MEKLRFLAARVLRLVRPYRVSLIFAGAALWRLLSPHQRGSAASRGGQSPKHILVVRLDAIGDLMMTSLIFRELKQRFPEASITAVIQPQCKALLETNPYVDRILSPQKLHPSLLLRGFRQDLAVFQMYRKHLRGTAIDLVVNPRLDGDLYSADVLLKLADPAKTFKYDETWKAGLAGSLNRFGFRKAVRLPRPTPRHEVLNNRTITESVTGTMATARPELFFTEQDLAYADKLFRSLPEGATVVCLALGAQAMRRVWPVDRWAETIRLISLQQPVFSLILCTKAEAAQANQLQAMLSTPSHILQGATLRQVAATIQACDLFMGPDSGMAHLAAAVNCPAVIVSPHPLRGSLDHGNSPVRFGPFSDHARVIQPENGIAPCVTGCDAIDPHCILQVVPMQVAEACLELLDEGGRSRSSSGQGDGKLAYEDGGEVVPVSESTK